MNNVMKHFKLLALLCMLGVGFASCEKNQKSEWNNFYGYTNADVIGTYSFSNVPGAFDQVEGVGRYACPDAEVRILVSSQNPDMLRFEINCPDENYTRTIEDYATPNDEDFMLRMSSGYIHTGGKVKVYEVNAHVMKNAKQEIRLSGFSAVNTYVEIINQETGAVIKYEKVDGISYYFDVIKN